MDIDTALYVQVIVKDGDSVTVKRDTARLSGFITEQMEIKESSETEARDAIMTVELPTMDRNTIGTCFAIMDVLVQMNMDKHELKSDRVREFIDYTVRSRPEVEKMIKNLDPRDMIKVMRACDFLCIDDVCEIIGYYLVSKLKNKNFVQIMDAFKVQTPLTLFDVEKVVEMNKAYVSTMENKMPMNETDKERMATFNAYRMTLASVWRALNPS